MLSSLIPPLSGARMTLEKREGGLSVLKSPRPSEQNCALSGAQGDDKHGLFESSEDLGVLARSRSWEEGSLAWEQGS